jgi:hypothetical protein
MLSIIGGQTAWPIGTKIGTHTHWDYAMKIWGIGVRLAQSGQNSRPARARSVRTSAKRECTHIEQGGEAQSKANKN